MRKRRIITFLCLLCVCFSGCKKDSTIPLVDKISVVREDGISRQSRVFTGSDMVQILNALRCLGNCFPCDVDPDELESCMYQIRLHYSNGFERIYCTKGERFLKEGDGGWQQAERKRIQNLHQVLDRLMQPREIAEKYVGPTKKVGLFCLEIVTLKAVERLT